MNVIFAYLSLDKYFERTNGNLMRVGEGRVGGFMGSLKYITRNKIVGL